MARAADGTMTLSGTFAVANTIPVSTTVNGYISDILTEVTDSLSRSGKGGMLTHLPMGSFKITSLADGVALTDAATVKQVQNRSISFIDGGGTADAITATYSPAVTAVVDGMTLFVEATAANATTTPTFAPNGLTARVIKKLHAQALAANDISGDGHVLQLQYHASGTYWNLLNPAASAPSAATTSAAGIVELATAAEYRTGTDTGRVPAIDQIWAAAATVALTWISGGNTAVDMATGINFTVTASAGNSTLGQPSNTKVGQTGFIRITQDSTPRTLAYHADWKFAGGTDPVISTANGAIDLLFYEVIATNFIYATLIKALA